MHKTLWNEDGVYNFEEQCPHCDNSIPIQIDESETARYQVKCPACGEMMMLCTLCKWDYMDVFGGTEYPCDWSEEKGCYRQRKGKEEK